MFHTTLNADQSVLQPLLVVVWQSAPEVERQLTWTARIQELGHCDVMHLTHQQSYTHKHT